MWPGPGRRRPPALLERAVRLRTARCAPAPWTRATWSSTTARSATWHVHRKRHDCPCGQPEHRRPGRGPLFHAFHRCGPPWLTRTIEGRSSALVGGRPFPGPAPRRWAWSQGPIDDSTYVAPTPSARRRAPSRGAPPVSWTTSSGPWTPRPGGGRGPRGTRRRRVSQAVRGARRQRPRPAGRRLHAALRRRARCCLGLRRLERRRCATWAFEGFDQAPAHSEVGFRFRTVDGEVYLDSVGGGGRRLPCGCPGRSRYAVPRSRWSSSTGPTRRRPVTRAWRGPRYRWSVRCCRSADRPGRGGAGSVAALHEALASAPGTYSGIAAVTTTDDGSLAPDAPVHVFVNPDIFGQLRPRVPRS